MTSLRAGIVGTGFIGDIHARAIRAAGGVLSCIAEVDERAAQRAEVRLAPLRSTTSLNALLENGDVDVVHICTPNALHAAAAEMALEAGKHVVCEKPLATTVEDAQRLRALADKIGRVATVPFIYRYYPLVREVRERISRNEAGVLHLLHGSYLQDWLSGTQDFSWRVQSALTGVSRAFADIGVHWCDLLEFTTGHRIARVSSRLVRTVEEREHEHKKVSVDTEDAALVLFETDGGAVGSFIGSQVSLGRKNQLRFSWDGSLASYVFDQEQPESLWVGGREESKLVLRGSDALSEAARRYVTVPAGHPQGYQDCFNAFIADTYLAVRGESPPGLPVFADGVRAAQVTDAVIKSAALGTWVEVGS